MSELPRLRRHADGRVALRRVGEADYWIIHSPDSRWPEVRTVYHDDVTGEGWTELFMAELPAPQGWVDTVGKDGEDAQTPCWRTSWGESVTAWIEGIETSVGELQEDLNAIRSDALKMLAAVAWCEQYRAN